MSACTEACRARVECTTCRRIKAPVGRSVAAEMANGMCTHDCPGYADAPAAGHLWPNEPLDNSEEARRRLAALFINAMTMTRAPEADGGKEGERGR